jgi:hypothetical protein
MRVAHRRRTATPLGSCRRSGIAGPRWCSGSRRCVTWEGVDLSPRLDWGMCANARVYPLPREPTKNVVTVGTSPFSERHQFASNSNDHVWVTLAAIATLSRTDCRSGRLCCALSQGALASRPTLIRFFRTADHVGRVGTYRRWS